MNLTDIVTADELRTFVKSAVSRQENPEFRARVDRLAPLLHIFVETLAPDMEPQETIHMLAMVCIIDEALEYATTKGRIQ